MGNGRYGGLPKGIKNITDRVLDKLYGQSAYMRNIHDVDARHRGLNSALNANPGNYSGDDAKPEISDFLDLKNRFIDFPAYFAAKEAWEKNGGLRDSYYEDVSTFQDNCQRGVIAWEMNYRGYDVEARPSAGEGDLLPKTNGEHNFLDAFHTYQGEKVEPLCNIHDWDIKGYYDMSKSQIGSIMRSKITDIMKREGNGARFVIDFGRRESLSGHTFTAEVRGNHIAVYEPQYARTSTLSHYINSDIDRVRVTRIDNAFINVDIAKQAVIPHKTRRHTNFGGTYSSRK